MHVALLEQRSIPGVLQCGPAQLRDICAWRSEPGPKSLVWNVFGIGVLDPERSAGRSVGATVRQSSRGQAADLDRWFQPATGP